MLENLLGCGDLGSRLKYQTGFSQRNIHENGVFDLMNYLSHVWIGRQDFLLATVSTQTQPSSHLYKAITLQPHGISCT